MANQKLFQIGDVAKMFHISVGSLRHYENLGLLKPEKTDTQTGYRYYSTGQFEVLNTIRYLRALDMPLQEIADFLHNRDIQNIEEKLKQQKAAIVAKQQQLKRIERKIDNRLRRLQDAQNSDLDAIKLRSLPPCRLVWVESTLDINNAFDMEMPIRRLEEKQAEALIFLGKVGVGIAADNLYRRQFSQYDGVFLLLDDEDKYSGGAMLLPQTDCVSVRFKGSHDQSPAQYEKLMSYIQSNNLQAVDFSREITMIDYGITNDPEKFVTEINIPVRRMTNEQND